MNRKIGIFGGSFNPIHMGHVNSMVTVAEKMNLSTIKVIPAAQAPLRQKMEGPSPKERAKMVQLAIQDYPEVLEYDDIELKRKGISYTIDTIKAYLQEYSSEELYLIIGADQFEIFDQWLKYGELLAKTNIIVTTRPGAYLPLAKEDFPGEMSELVAEFDGETAVLSSGRSIHFIKLKDLHISSSDIRKRLRTGKSTVEQLDSRVEKYIHEHKLYNTVGEKIKNYEKFTRFCGQALFDRKAINVQGFDLHDLDKPAEYTVVASGTSKRHTSSLAERVIDRVKEEYGVFPYNVEGIKDGRWVVIDYGSLLIHLFYDYVRSEYSIEDLWSDGKNLNLEDKDLKRQSS
ncbi:MAG: nicotinate (nicotinamide) nucleotide adenylyltransferase [Bdellovibrionales bacterium]